MMPVRNRYNLLTATATVVGSVIGSGVFFKAEAITRITDGDIASATASWTVGALVMLLCLSAFAIITKTSGAEGGLYSISKAAFKGKYSYFIGLFMAIIYYPSLVSVLSYLCARYTLLTLGMHENFLLCALLSCFFLVTAFLQNTFAAHLSGRIQLITTVIKLIPLIAMIVLGISKGVATGILYDNLSAKSVVPFRNSFFPGVSATLFAYEGWISATGIGKSLENSRKNFPVALLGGGFIITSVYILYYLGIMSAVDSATLINYGADGIKIAFSNILGKWGGLLTAFVAISCFGALEALTMGSTRANEEFFRKTPRHSFLIGVITSVLWLFYLFGEQWDIAGKFRFDSTELPVVTIYALYIPIFFKFAKKEKSRVNKVLYIGGISASVFALLCGTLAHIGELAAYIAILSSIMLLGSLFHKKTG